MSLFFVQVSIVRFMEQKFDRITNTQRALNILHKFECLNLSKLDTSEQYHRILMHYTKDIEIVSRLYQKHKTDPPVARDQPPVAGETNIHS